MANENAVTNIADLWVAAAMNVDNEDPFETDSEDEDALDLDEDSPFDIQETFLDDSPTTRRNQPQGVRSHRPSAASIRGSAFGSPLRPTQSRQSQHDSPLRNQALGPSTSVQFQTLGSPLVSPSRRPSSVAMPTIFAHAGVKTPAAVLDAQQNQQLLTRTDTRETRGENQPLISERADVESLVEQPPSLMSQIPLLVVAQYGMLALHTTTHDQVFMLYLVS
jgi:hypothetical protein